MEENVVLVGMIGAPVILAVIQALKMAFRSVLPDRVLPLLAMAIGVTWNVGLTVGTDEFDRTSIFLGLLVGLSASGLYSGAREVLKK